MIDKLRNWYESESEIVDVVLTIAFVLVFCIGVIYLDNL